MNPRVQVLKQLVADGHYVVAERAIADAILLRAMAARVLPDLTFRCTDLEPAGGFKVRSFRPHRGARSFRLMRAMRRQVHAHTGAAMPAA